ncbi:hypothetical protein GUJ93_ZPchr0007g4186 [Zizania palustris]|uniref:Uncharacterized protein n=1 Tax=Zizania palustris TaxID=103762 RepID=A0A8J5W5H8_ZIZPA|nr:hypothetical protein GUJ93_ZPchr0007g4186 [Zizania palustris]
MVFSSQHQRRPGPISAAVATSTSAPSQGTTSTFAPSHGAPVGAADVHLLTSHRDRRGAVLYDSYSRVPSARTQPTSVMAATTFGSSPTRPCDDSRKVFIQEAGRVQCCAIAMRTDC